VEKAPAKAAPARGAAAVVVEGEARSMLSLEKTGTIHHLRESPFLDRVAAVTFGRWRSGGTSSKAFHDHTDRHPGLSRIP